MRVTFPQSGHTSCTLLACSAPSRSTIPPLMLRCGFARVWRLIMFTPSTTRRLVEGMTFSTRPRLPLYLPVVTTTVSFFRIGVCSLDIVLIQRFHCPRTTGTEVRSSSACEWRSLQHLRREGNDLHEPSLTQLTGDRPEHARADRLVLIVDEHGGVAIEPDVAAVAAALLLPRPHDHRLHDLAFLDRAVRRRFLDRRGDDVAEARVATRGPADR